MKWLLLPLLLLVSSRGVAQVNLVLNPDFELRTACPMGNDEIKVCKFWTGVDSVGVLTCIPDYCNSCATDVNVSVPSGFTYFQHPHSGNGMIRLTCYFDSSYSTTIENRAYLQGRFWKKLDAGKRYCVSFWINLCEGSRYAVKEISAYFDNGSIDTSSNCGLPLTRYVPQFTYNGPIIMDTMNWVKIEGSFIANGTERYITIGNFKDKAHSTIIQMPGNGWNANVAEGLYLIDDVSLVESNTRANAGPDTHVGKGDSVFIGLPDKALDCYWTKLGSSTVIGTGAGIWVKPTVATSYVVTMMLCGAVTKDTVNVQVWKLGVSSINGQTQHYSLAPNPNNGSFELKQRVANKESIKAEAYDVVGRKVWGSAVALKDGTASVSIPSNVPAGVYYLRLEDGNGNTTVLRFIKQ